MSQPRLTLRLDPGSPQPSAPGPSAKALVASFSVLGATARNWLAAPMAHTAALLADVVMRGTVSADTDTCAPHDY